MIFLDACMHDYWGYMIFFHGGESIESPCGVTTKTKREKRKIRDRKMKYLNFCFTCKFVILESIV